MKCLLCGAETDKVLCGKCAKEATEDLCYRIINYNYYNSDNDLWKEVSEGLDKPYMFTDYSLDVAEMIGGKRADFIKVTCMINMSRKASRIGVPKAHREYVLSCAEKLMKNDALTEAEKNLVKALAFEIYVSMKQWDWVYKNRDSFELDNSFIDPYLIKADYNIKIRDYKQAQKILEQCKTVFTDEDSVQRADWYIQDCNSRLNGEKKPWKPKTTDETVEYYEYLDKIGVDHDVPGRGQGGKKNKINIKDFKPFNYYEDNIPRKYVALWITSEFQLKQREAVEINAVRIAAGKIIDEYHSFVKPVSTPKTFQHINPEDLGSALPIKDVFPEFLTYLKDDIVAIAGVEEQKIYLSRLARYSMMDHFDNMIFDVVAYGEELSDDFDLYTRESLLEKHGLKDRDAGMDKAKVTYELIEKMRG